MIKKGFSLAEMMVVMLILSIVLAAATPIITKRVIASSSSSSSDSSLPAGVIVIWKGSVATIPDGWHLCDGTNGTPDLRSRFVYGAGGDINTKASYVYGWDAAVNGHLQVGTTGGEEQHILNINEMPKHNHSYTLFANYRNYHPDGSTPNVWYNFNNSGQSGFAGGDQPHNILPRFYCLAYIMKL